MSTTFAAWIDDLETLAPTGVVKKFTAGPPNSLSTADLPAQWLELPHGENQPACAGAEGGMRTLFVDYVVVLQAVAQDTQAVNFAAAVTMLDSVNTAIAAHTSLLLGPMTWRSRVVTIAVGSVNYWAVVTEIEGLG